ncbi:MAG TPA: hypothetical protein PK263_00715 [bacterium]|nr:hypothetical protein [bacterium]
MTCNVCRQIRVQDPSDSVAKILLEHQLRECRPLPLFNCDGLAEAQRLGLAIPTPCVPAAGEVAESLVKSIEKGHGQCPWLN